MVKGRWRRFCAHLFYYIKRSSSSPKDFQIRPRGTRAISCDESDMRYQKRNESITRKNSLKRRRDNQQRPIISREFILFRFYSHIIYGYFVIDFVSRSPTNRVKHFVVYHRGEHVRNYYNIYVRKCTSGAGRSASRTAVAMERVGQNDFKTIYAFKIYVIRACLALALRFVVGEYTDTDTAATAAMIIIYSTRSLYKHVRPCECRIDIIIQTCRARSSIV